jgi:hypothetical protein
MRDFHAGALAMHSDSADVLVVEQKRMSSRSRRLALLALGFVFLLVVPWTQRAFWLSPCPGQISGDCAGPWEDLRWTLTIEMALCIAFILAAAAISFADELERITGRIASWIGQRTNLCISVTALVATLLPLAAAYFVLDRFLNSGDEDGYLFQANAFAALRLWEAPPILGTDMIPFRTYLFENKWISQSPPSWPMVLATGLWLGIPAWMMNALLGGGSVVALAAFCRRVANPSAAVVAAALFALTPFYVMNAASYFPHILASLLILLFCLCLLPDGDIPQGYRLVAAGAIIGLVGATRYYSVLPLIPATLLWLTRQRRSAWPRLVGLLAAGLIPVLLLMMTYHYLITGSPFHTAYYVINTPEVSSIFVGFDPLHILYGFALTGGRLIELALWTSPVLLILYGFCLVLKFRDRKLAFYDLIFPGFVLAYVIYADFGGNRYGPRFYFDGFPLMFVTIVSALPSITARLERPIDRAMLPLAPIACLLYLVSIWPLVLTGFKDQVFSREEPARLVQQAVTGKAVIIHDTSAHLGFHPWDLVRNPPSMDADVLHVRVGTDVSALRKAFPDRAIWRYSRLHADQPGKLTPVTP